MLALLILLFIFGGEKRTETFLTDTYFYDIKLERN
jgi:Galactose oxidase, central domain